MSELDKLLDQVISQVRGKPKVTETLYVVDVTVGQSVSRLWTLNKKVAVVVPNDSKLREILELLAEGKIVVVEVERDGLVQRCNIVRVLGGVDVPEEKMLRVKVEPHRSGVSLAGDGVRVRPDSLSFNCQRLIQKYEEGTVEVLAVPVACDSSGRCFGIQWKPVSLEKYMSSEYAVEAEVKAEEVSAEEIATQVDEAVEVAGKEAVARISLRDEGERST